LQKHRLALIVDEVFLDFPFGSTPRKTFVANSEALTFTLSGLSKISALPQMKIAWLAVTGPDSQVRPALDRLEIIADTYLSLSAQPKPLFRATRPAALPSPATAPRIRENLAHLQSNSARVQSVNSSTPKPAGTPSSLRRKLLAHHSDEDLAIHLLRHHQSSSTPATSTTSPPVATWC